MTAIYQPFATFFLILQIRSDDSNTAINLLTRVAGIGPAKAHSLVDSGITTILELRDPANQVIYRYSLDVPLDYKAILPL